MGTFLRRQRRSLLQYQEIKALIRIDKSNGEPRPGNLRHIHIYAKGGKQLFAMNVDGTSHDGCHSVKIPDDVASFLSKKGFTMPDNNIIEFCNVTSTKQQILDEVKSKEKAQSFQLVESNVSDYNYMTILCNTKISKYNKIKILDSFDSQNKEEFKRYWGNKFNDYANFISEIIQIFDGGQNSKYYLYVVWSE